MKLINTPVTLEQELNKETQLIEGKEKSNCC